MKVTQKRFLVVFAVITLILALVRLFFPSVSGERHIVEQTALADSLTTQQKDSMITIVLAQADFVLRIAAFPQSQVEENQSETIMPSVPVTAPVAVSDSASRSIFFNPDGTLAKHPIFSVSSYKACFPDSNSVQLSSASKLGVSPVANRIDAEKRKNELVYVGGNPFFYVEPLKQSIPYLIPKAAVLLQDIGRNFMDSLQIKQIPLHKIRVTSVLRTKDDVDKLRKRNQNATENSCHLYGTTFDISYTKYVTVSDPAGPQRRAVQNDTLKYVLSEVLRDLRVQNRCYIKYEVKQACFHITVR